MSESSTQPPVSSSRWENIQTILTVGISATAFIGYGFTYIGRRYLYAYLAAQHIPLSLITLSTWEITESGGLVLLTIFLLMLIGVTVASSIFALAEAIAKQSLWVRLLFLILPAGLYIYGFIQSNPSLVISSLGLFVGSGFLFFAPPTWQLSPISTDTLTNTQQSTIDRFYRRLFARSFLGLLVVSLLVLVLIGLESIAVHAGQNLGHASIARAQAVRLVAPSPLAIQAPQATTITINSTPTMIYSGLYLMLATSDRYYLFSCLTPTGGPDSLIMLNSDTDLTLEILPDVSPPAPCSGTPMPSSSPTPAAP